MVRADALTLLRTPLQGRFDIVFVDPPFDDDLWSAVLAALPPWLADDAWLYLESPAASTVEPGPGWRLHRESPAAMRAMPFIDAALGTLECLRFLPRIAVGRARVGDSSHFK